MPHRREPRALVETPGHRRKRLEASKLNAVAAISALPPEILSHIFLFCVYANCAEGTTLDWLAITRVTQRWRQIAMSCPELWANIIFRRKLLPIMLARAKMVPLVMRVFLEPDKPYQPQYILTNISKVGELSVSGSEETLETFFPEYVGKTCAPRLRSLSVKNTSSREAFWLDAMVFHASERSETHPSRQLHLEKCAIPWNSPWYCNLTDLYLANLHNTQGPTITTLFSIIVASPLLQNLTLINTHTQHVDHWECFFPITLPHLVTLHISEPISVCVQLLITLTLPSIVTKDICCSPRLKKEDAWLIPSLVSHHDLSGMDLIRIEAKDSLRVKAGGYRTKKTFDLEIDHGAPPTLLKSVLQSYSRTSFHSITSLHIDMPLLGAWGSVTPLDCPNVKTLSLNRTDCAILFTLLLERAFRCIGVSVGANIPSQLDQEGVCVQLFPKLECIVLQDINCGRFGQCSYHTADILRALLWARRAGRSPIRRVQLERCKNVSKQDLDHLAYLTDSFIWDGVGQNTKEEDGHLDLRSYSLNVFELLMRGAGLPSR
ncbi:hypothetical protein C8F04DRAFT_1227921 [Mycena alexandri]|uniref:F-box domain-containing protein n=1 Tax=Mycena alexandri TaxID=1745969 RepID=A0AAD6XF13_9AGAR|nr:hypothetical protein C8F04DRAFT_1227921 [Mycena alexandri]